MENKPDKPAIAWCLWDVESYLEPEENLTWNHEKEEIQGENLLNEIYLESTPVCLAVIHARELRPFLEEELLYPLILDSAGEEWSQFPTKPLELFKHSDNVFALPEDLHSQIFISRKDTLEENGFSHPENWEELLLQVKELSDKYDQCAISLMMGSSSYLNLFYMIFGSNGVLLNNELKETINSRQLIMETYEWMIEFFSAARFDFVFPKSKSLNLNFQKGTVAFHLGSNKDLIDMQEEVLNQINVSSFPNGPSGQKNQYIPMDGSVWVIPKNTLYPEVGMKILRQIKSINVIKKMGFDSERFFSALKPIWHDKEVLDKRPYFKFMKNIMETPFNYFITHRNKNLLDFQQRTIFALHERHSPEKWWSMVSDLFESFANRKELHSSICEALQYIDDHLTEIKNIKQIAQSVKLSPDYFRLLFKEELSVSCEEYMKNKKMSLAKQLLGDFQLGIKQISYQLGFGSTASFSHAFRKHSGISPSEWRKKVI